MVGVAYDTGVVHTRDMNTTSTANNEYLTCGKSWMGARVIVRQGIRSGEAGTVIKVNKRSIRVAMDRGDTMIGHAIYFEAVA